MIKEITLEDLIKDKDNFNINAIFKLAKACDNDGIKYILRKKETSRGTFINFLTYDKQLYRYTIVQKFQINQ